MITSLLLILLSLPVLTEPLKYETLQQKANQVVEHSAMKHGRWGFYAVNSTTGEIIIDIDGEKTLAPASNQKLVTSAAALSLLGAETTVMTYLEYTGRIEEHILQGDLYIRGEGDPTLGSCYFDTTTCIDKVTAEWITAVTTLGIKEIRGNIIGDDCYFDHMPLPGAWSWTDIGNYYAPPTSGLSFHDNLYYLFFRPAGYVGGPAEVIKTEPEIPGLVFFNHMKTGAPGSGDNGFIYAAPWQHVHQLEGTIPAGLKEFSIKGSIPDPAQYTAHALKNALTQNNITVAGDALSIRNYSEKNHESRNMFHTLSSPTIGEIIHIINKKSFNLYAEQILKLIGKKIEDEGSLDKGIEAIENWLEIKNISTDGIFIHDGSGLSVLDRLSAKFLVDLLIMMQAEPEFDVFYDSLPIAGDPDDIGTMSRLCRNTKAAYNLRAKTGSHVRIRSHSGYVRSRSGDIICFAMLANDYTGSSRIINKLHEQVMIQLAELP